MGHSVQFVSECRRLGIKMVSHETIYQYIWWDKAHGGDLYKHLRHRGKRHKKRGDSRKRRGVIPNRIDISERPKIVNHKTRVGDYEVDTIVGAAHSQHILTMNERPKKRHGFLSPDAVFSRMTGLDAGKFV